MLLALRKLTSSLFIFFLLINLTFAAGLGTAPGVTKNSSNFLGGIFHGQFTHGLTYNTAASVIAEAGPRNYRASGTVGMAINPRNRIKLTGEYLTQDIDYNFYSGRTRQWVEQGAFGAEYQYALYDRLQDYLFLKGFYSHAPSKSLGTRSGSFIDSSGNTVLWTNMRRIAGSNAGGINPGVTSHPWLGAEASIGLNYDSVVYDNKYQTKRKAQGFGSTGSITQAFFGFGQLFQAGVSAAFRAPFNYYQASLDWVNPFRMSNLLVGVFGGYTVGKQTLPSTSLVGLNLAYAFDAPAPVRQAIHQSQSFISWVAQPAVNLPQVLAIADEGIQQVTPICIAPTAVGTIPVQPGITGAPYTFDTSPFFNGNGETLTFSATGLPPGLSINPTTGVISGSATASGTFNIVVTASSRCGSATQRYTLTVST